MNKEKNCWFDWDVHLTLWGIGYVYEVGVRSINWGNLTILNIMLGPFTLRWTHN